MRVAKIPFSPVSFSKIKSAMRWPVKRISASLVTNDCASIAMFFSVSLKRKRTSNFPLAKRFTEPVTTASTALARHSVRLTLAVSLVGARPLTIRKFPLRSRSLRITSDTDCRPSDSPTKPAIATGICVVPTPEISIFTCAVANPLDSSVTATVVLSSAILKKWFIESIKLSIRFHSNE